MRLRAIGIKGAWLLDKELFGWRRFTNRRELASSLGLVPTPYDSGDRQVEQGISKAGNKRVRALLVELAWAWLRLQPDSALTQWFNRRTQGTGNPNRDYEGRTRDELYNIARERGLEGRSRMSKDELIDALRR